MSSETITRHGTCIDVAGQGVVLFGQPGSGKSSLALRLIDAPGYGLGSALQRATLVADDQVEIIRHGELLHASAPALLKGKLEVRGIGILPCPVLASTRLVLAVNLIPANKSERLPERQTMDILGVELPLIALDASLPAAPARLRAALSSLVNLTTAFCLFAEKAKSPKS